MNIIKAALIYSLLYQGIFCSDNEEDEELPIIEISTGFLQAGYRDLSYKGTTFTAFEGIPFAKPPIGELRFQPPQEPYNWTGIWKANTKYTCTPFMKAGFYSNMPDSEDCLYLNIYVPNSDPTPQDNFDVVVHIHSGGFTVGHPHFATGPKFLLDEEHIILITLNYRLGPLGFLSTQDEIIPGNNGLKDQVMALKWIQKNIKYFGGNPNSVTITGSLSGGASVHYHYLSPLSKGLFHKGYSGSGTALDPWSLQEEPLQKAKRLAVLLGCNPLTSQDILNCVMQRSTQAIFEASQKFFERGMPFSPFSPVIEVQHKNAFLTEHPYKLLKDGPVQDLPWIVVINKNEGLFPAGPYYENIKNINDDWNNFAPHLLDYNFTIPHSKRDDISNKIKTYYFKDKPVTFKKLVKACSDRHYFRGAELSIKLQRQLNKSPIYMLVFAYQGDVSYSSLFNVPIADRGVANGDDSLYYLSSNMMKHNVRFNDEKIKDVMVKIVSSFAKDGVPKVKDVEWKPISADKLEYLYLNSSESLKMKQTEDIGANKFWKTLGLKENENYFISIKDEL